MCPRINLDQIGAPGYASSPSIGAALDATITGNPGADWMIGNEPDRRYYQNDMEPAAYAHAYHDLYYTSRERRNRAHLCRRYRAAYPSAAAIPG